MFKNFTTSLIGSMPRSKKLMSAKRALRRDEISKDEFDEILHADTLKIIELQEKYEIEIITSGELQRDNYVSFVADKLNGVKQMNMADLIEYMPNHQAFEKILQILDVPSLSIKNAICVDKISKKSSLVAEEMKFLQNHTKYPLKATLPGAYLLTRSMWLGALSTKFYKDKKELGKDVIEILKDEVKLLAKMGISVVQFDEPVLSEVVFSKGKTRSFMCAALSEKNDVAPELAFAAHLIKSIGDFAKSCGIKVGLHVCRGNWSKDEKILLSGSYSPLIPLFEEVLPDILFLEFSTPRAGEIQTLLKNKKISQDCILGLGVINPRSDIIESKDFIKSAAKKAMKFLSKEQIWLNPDCGFATFANRPVNDFKIISQKLAALNEAKNELRNE